MQRDKNIILRNIKEVVTEDELNTILEKEKVSAYIGFEPSGFMHLGTGLIWGEKIKDLLSQNIDVTILLADWHAYINDKFGGDMDKIQTCAEYMKECFTALGVKNAIYVYANDLVDEKEYWEKVIKIAKKSSLQRVKRAMSIMGRKEEDSELDSSKLIYPFMQVADIFHLEADIAIGGMDQRHAHMLARDVAEKLKWKKPSALHGPLLSGLKGGDRMDPVEAKMSKSDPSGTIYIHDSEKEIKTKLNKAYCPEGIVDGNPVMDILQYIIFQKYDEITIKRPEKFGGDLSFSSYNELEQTFINKEIHPMDLKNTTSSYLSEILKPVREHFEKHPEKLEAMSR